MRLSRIYLPTLHRAPAEAVEASHRLLLRAGLLRPLGSGSFAYLPLGQQVRRRLQELARQSLTPLGGQEMALPPLVPEALGQGSAVSLRDTSGRALLLPSSLEALVTHLLGPDVRSHRSLPLTLYAFRHHFGDESSAGLGPLSARQSLVLEVWTVQPDSAALTAGLTGLQRACRALIERCGLGEGLRDIAYPGEDQAHHWVVPAVPGEHAFVRCPQCGYMAALDRACRAKEPDSAEEPLPLEPVHTPDCHTIAQVAAFLGIPERRTAKAVFLVAGDSLVFAVTRGDMAVDETKLAGLVGVERFRPALEHEIAALGASPGYASPIGIRRSAPEAGIAQVLVVVDDLVARSPNLVAGANRDDTHLRNVNYGRDYTADLVGDIVAVDVGDPCPVCRAPLEGFATTVLARLWAAGTRYSDGLGATFQDAAGQEHPPHLGCAQVEVDRLLAACVEMHHDEAGIRWPAVVAPYAVHLVTIGSAPEVLAAAAGLEEGLAAAGFPVLWDDRDQSAGSKFVEADLLGMPLRVTVSNRTVAQGAAELKRREEPREAVRMLPLAEVPGWVHRVLRETENGKPTTDN
jgi:prolyl-tRNA synthetase